MRVVAFWMLLVSAVARVSLAAPADADPPVIEPLPVALPAPGAPAALECKITDKSGVFDPTLFWRAAGSAAYARVALEPKGAGSVFRAVVAAPAGTAALEYYVEAYDENGNGPAVAGTAARPLRAALVVEAPPPPPPPPPPQPAARKPAPVERPPERVAERPSERPPAPAAALAPVPPPPPGMTSPARVFAVGAFAAGATALAVAATFGLLASSSHAAFKSSFEPATHAGSAAAVRSQSLASDVSLGVGGVFLLAGTASWLLSSGAR